MNMGLCRFPMTPGHMTLTLGPRKIHSCRKVAFLLRLSVLSYRVNVCHFVEPKGPGFGVYYYVNRSWI